MVIIDFPCFLFAYCSPLFICFRVHLIIHAPLSISPLGLQRRSQFEFSKRFERSQTPFSFLTCDMYWEIIIIKKSNLSFRRIYAFLAAISGKTTNVVVVVWSQANAKALLGQFCKSFHNIKVETVIPNVVLVFWRDPLAEL